MSKQRYGWTTSVLALACSMVACGGRAFDQRSAGGGAEQAEPGDGTNPHCVDLAQTCGPEANRDCCASSVVPGISTPVFYRSYENQSFQAPSNPAIVHDFRLDSYEITVGRFRKFVAAYTRAAPAVGSGKNPNNPSDPGWSSAWNANLPRDASALTATLKCQPGGLQTWTDEAGDELAESRPLNCLNWFEAQAFCIWDGGRLPTEAEWQYAAAGGTEQRRFPWGEEIPQQDANLAVYGCFASHVDCHNVANIARVGSIPAGNAKWGQADMAGNVNEWVQDWYADVYQNPCDNCANLTPDVCRVLRGGGLDFSASNLGELSASWRGCARPEDAFYGLVGARCARQAH